MGVVPLPFIVFTDKLGQIIPGKDLFLKGAAAQKHLSYKIAELARKPSPNRNPKAFLLPIKKREWDILRERPLKYIFSLQAV